MHLEDVGEDPDDEREIDCVGAQGQVPAQQLQGSEAVRLRQQHLGEGAGQGERLARLDVRGRRVVTEMFQAGVPEGVRREGLRGLERAR